MVKGKLNNHSNYDMEAFGFWQGFRHVSPAKAEFTEWNARGNYRINSTRISQVNDTISILTRTLGTKIVAHEKYGQTSTSSGDYGTKGCSSGRIRSL